MLLEYQLFIKEPSSNKVISSNKIFYTSVPFQVGECFQIPGSGLLKKGETYRAYKEEGFFRILTIIRDVKITYDKELYDTEGNTKLEKVYFNLIYEHFHIQDVYEIN